MPGVVDFLLVSDGALDCVRVRDFLPPGCTVQAVLAYGGAAHN